METLAPVPLLILLVVVSTAIPYAAAAAAATATATDVTSPYDVLKSHGLPAGLLPKGVKSFRVDDQGRFEAHLDGPCTAKFETEVQYEANVTGILSYGQIAPLSGVSAQELFLWFPVRGIRVDIPSSGLIYFDVGVIYKQFSLSLFENPPECKPLSSPLSLEGARVSAMVDQSKSGKLRYDLDQGVYGDARRASA